MRVCQFRHFGKSDSVRRSLRAAFQERDYELIFYRGIAGCQT
jgi:hypothetical protein